VVFDELEKPENPSMAIRRRSSRLKAEVVGTPGGPEAVT
jgi:hypothetical protein